MIVLDRFENDKAIIEVDEEVQTIDASLVNAAEGDVLVKCDDGTYISDKEATLSREKRIKSKFDSLF